MSGLEATAFQFLKSARIVGTAGGAVALICLNEGDDVLPINFRLGKVFVSPEALGFVEVADTR